MAPLIFGLALIMVFLFLAAQYESWATPFSVHVVGTSWRCSERGRLHPRYVGFDNNIYTQIGLCAADRNVERRTRF